MKNISIKKFVSKGQVPQISDFFLFFLYFCTGNECENLKLLEKGKLKTHANEVQ